MPQLHFCAGTNDQCYACDEPGDEAGGNPLRRCSRCQIARYCSPECQRIDWAKHKQSRMDHKANLETYRDSSMKKELKAFLKWFDVWRAAIAVWAVFAADLANQLPDYLLDHSYFLYLERHPQAAKLPAAAKYQVYRGGMCSDADVLADLQHIPDAEYRGQIINNFHLLRPARKLIRFTVGISNHYIYANGSGDLISRIFPDGQARAFTNPLSAESRLLSAALAKAWSQKFAEHVCTGDVSGHIQILEELKQTTHANSEMVLDVD
ncbi:hypothetical protein C8R44DRAFT_73592 [Mycena epipterygia]|nr:hypothetical protein C8R44DRAFT_73592 [Mycena epipterygia]